MTSIALAVASTLLGTLDLRVLPPPTPPGGRAAFALASEPCREVAAPPSTPALGRRLVVFGLGVVAAGFLARWDARNADDALDAGLGTFAAYGAWAVGGTAVAVGTGLALFADPPDPEPAPETP